LPIAGADVIDITSALEALRAGLIIGLPTDTVYGVAVDPFSESAMHRLYELKGRPDDKAIPILAADAAQARGIGVVPEPVETYWPGPLTVVVPRLPGVPRWIGDAERGTVAIRVPDHPVALEVLSRFGPLAVTSANRSGEEAAIDDAGARRALGDGVEVYLEGRGSQGAASTVVDLTGDVARVLRPGPVAWGP
jgi:L-threonylcarbamoyladenylate synthase